MCRKSQSTFLFGDAIDEDDRILHDGDYKWLRQIGDRKFFLPNMERMYPLSYLQQMSVHRAMDRDLSHFVSGVSLGRLGAKEYALLVMRKRSLVYFSSWSDLNIREEKPLSLALLSSTSL